MGVLLTDRKFKYDYLRYNRHHVLRPGSVLIGTLCFLIKDMFLIAIVGASALRGGGSQSSELLNLIHPVFFFSNLPVLAVFYALGMRQPSASALPRLIWKNGRYLIMFAALFYVFLLFHIRGYALLKVGILDGIAIGINAIIFGYIFMSPFIKDLFSEFPEPTETNEEPKPSV